MKRNFSFDTVVVGGGTAGCAAAVGAAAAGAKTLLIERNPYLGGEATHSGVAAFCGIFTCGADPVQCVKGVGQEVLDALAELGDTYDIITSPTGNRNVNFKPEYLKVALENLLDKHGVTLLLHARVIAADVENGAIVSLRCVDDDGEFSVTAKAFVDTTGDANLARMAGARAEWAEDGVQAATLPFRLANVDTSKPMTPDAVEAAVKKGKEAGIPNLVRERGFVLKKINSQMVAVLLPSLIPTGISTTEMTQMERGLRKQVIGYVKALREFMPGMENAELALIGPSIGFRETRRIVGRDKISADDVLERRKRPDSVARGGWKPEIHKSASEPGVYIDVAGGSWFDIPLGALESAYVDNLFAAGRMISADSIAHAAVRVMGTCFATGHAAGVAAAKLALTGKAEAEEVRAELMRQGALI